MRHESGFKGWVGDFLGRESKVKGERVSDHVKKHLEAACYGQRSVIESELVTAVAPYRLSLPSLGSSICSQL